MRGSIRTRWTKAGAKRYDCIWRAGGKQHWKTFKRKKDADAWLVEVCKEVQDGTFREVQPAPMSEVFEAWLEHEVEVRLATRDQMKPSTARSYRSVVEKHLVPAFGNVNSDCFTPAVVGKWRRGMAQRIGRGELTKKTYNNVRSVLKQIAAWAREPAQGYLRQDPLKAIKPMKIDRAEKREAEARFLEADEIAALLVAARSPEESAVVHLGLFAGLRRGEIFALRWEDIEREDDRGSGRVHVRQAISGGQVGGPKTAYSTRTVDVPRDVVDALEAQRQSVEEECGWVFPSAAGDTPLDPDNWYLRSWKALRCRAGLPNDVGLHSLRHTFASLLIHHGENIKYVSRQLGHSSTSFTLDIYGHLFQEAGDRAMGRLQKAIRSAKARRFDVVSGGTAI